VGSSAITPWELLDIRTNLLSTNSIHDLQSWVMILISIKLFLRSDELVHIRIQDFVSDLCFEAKDGSISMLGIKVKGIV